MRPDCNRRGTERRSHRCEIARAPRREAGSDGVTDRWHQRDLREHPEVIGRIGLVARREIEHHPRVEHSPGPAVLHRSDEDVVDSAVPLHAPAGAVVPRALQAAQKLEREQGVKVELIDLRCLNPFDWDTIAASVAKTNRALVAYEDTLSWGYGAEIAARLADQLFDRLDAPVRRVAAKDVFVAYQPILEDAILPQPNDLFLAMKELAEY